MIAAGLVVAAVVSLTFPALLGLRRPSRSPAATDEGADHRSPRNPAENDRRTPAGDTGTARSALLGGRLVQRLRLQPRPVTTRSWIAALDTMARAAATGSSLTAAVTESALHPAAPAELRSIDRELQGGAPLADAIDRSRSGRSPSVAHARHPFRRAAGRPTDDPDAALAITVLAALARHGGPAASALDRAASTLRERATAADERRVAAAQARLSAQVLSVLPGVVALWTVAGGGRGRQALGSSVGLVCLGLLGAALDLLGWTWMRRIVGSR